MRIVPIRTPNFRKTSTIWDSQQTWSQTLSRLTRSRRQRFPRLKVPPTYALALRNDGSKSRSHKIVQATAQQKNERLPVLTLQRLLQRRCHFEETTPSNAAATLTPTEWADRLNSLVSRGWTREDLDHWAWILEGENGDDRIDRFVSGNEPKPLFLLFVLVRKDATLRTPESLVSLIKYTRTHYLFLEKACPSTGKTPQDIASKHELGTKQFLFLLRRLSFHVQRIWPQSLPTLARLVVDFISQGHQTETVLRWSYPQQCRVFNVALRLFEKPASRHPISNMDFNWRAQRLLLSMSDSLTKPLIINRLSYRAIRKVIVGLKKSTQERIVAMRYAKTWPPYRQDFDGQDAKRTREDDHSRSVRAGILMQEAGYATEDYDRALDVLGGKGSVSPTVHTRSLPPREMRNDKQGANFFSTWAMTVRSTRNAQEAWQAFNKIGRSSGRDPNIQVYTEMFIKLLSRNVDTSSTVLPGDSRENTPSHHANYSEYEIARLAPPTVTEMYQHMISHGVKPDGYCLTTLVSNAGSVEEGLQYLRDSDIDPYGVNSLGIYNGRPPYSVLRRIPLQVFNSYIKLLCRLQPRRKGRQWLNSDELLRIRHAIVLVKARLPPETTEGATFSPPWHNIFRALAGRYVVVKNGPEWINDGEVLKLFLKVLGYAKAAVGVDCETFICLNRTVEKAAVSFLRAPTISGPGVGDQQSSLPADDPSMPPGKPVSKILTTMFSELTRSVQGSKRTLAQFKDTMSPAHLHAYMRALAYLEEHDEMANLTKWILDHRKYVEEAAAQMEYRGQSLIAKTFCAFFAFAWPTRGSHDKERLTSQMSKLVERGGFWRWPTEDEVESYVRSDGHRGSQILRDRVLERLRRTGSPPNHNSEKLERVAALSAQ